ncbi:metal ABC transporter permease [Bacteroidota bacterium]
MIELFFNSDFLTNSLIACILASISCGIIGPYIVVKRIVFISGGIAHTAYGGIGLGYLLGFNPLLGAVGFSIASACFISYMKITHKQYEDTLIGIMWSAGMALGVLFVYLSPGYAPDLMSYLFGNILTISESEILLITSLNIIIILTVVFNFANFQAIIFDEEYSYSIGLPVNKLNLLLMILIALTVVILIKLVGIILVIALMTIPASISRNFASSMKGLMIISTILGIVFSILGLLLSYYLNLPSGSTIILVAVIVYLTTYFKNTFLKIKDLKID